MIPAEVQNEGMCIVTAAARPTSCDSLRYWLDFSTLQHLEKTMAAKEFLRALVSWSYPFREDLLAREDTKEVQRLKIVQSWACFARQVIEDICSV